MKWTITNTLYAFVASLMLTGLFLELKLTWIGNAFVVLDITLGAIAFLKYLNGEHLQ